MKNKNYEKIKTIMFKEYKSEWSSTLCNTSWYYNLLRRTPVELNSNSDWLTQKYKSK